MISSELKYSKTGDIAKVTKYGQLVTGAIDFSTFYPVTASVVDTAYNIVPPITGKRFVITAIILYANKDVGPSDATVEIYESDSVDGITVAKSVYKQEMLKNTTVPLTSLNVLVGAGKWLNIKTNDNTIFANVAGYYLNVN